MTSVFDPRDVFPHFYDNPAIRTRLAGSSRWTVSGQIGDDPTQRKAPINIRELLTSGRLRGAWSADETCLLTLDELTARLPNAANCAFHLRAQVDALMMIDIEPGCPVGIAADLIDALAPETLYAEMSMSGHGYHLLVRTPSNFWDFTNASCKKVLREEHGWYEILLEHWITFTRRELVRPTNTAPTGHGLPRFSTVAGLYADLARNARANGPSSSSIEVALDVPDIPAAGEIVEQAVQGYVPRPLSDFHDDTSRWEFSIMNGLYPRVMQAITLQITVNRFSYSVSDRVWLLFLAAGRVLPAREKHREARNNRPFLLDRAAALVADRESRPLFTPGGP